MGRGLILKSETGDKLPLLSSIRVVVLCRVFPYNWNAKTKSSIRRQHKTAVAATPVGINVIFFFFVLFFLIRFFFWGGGEGGFFSSSLLMMRWTQSSLQRERCAMFNSLGNGSTDLAEITLTHCTFFSDFFFFFFCYSVVLAWRKVLCTHTCTYVNSFKYIRHVIIRIRNGWRRNELTRRRTSVECNDIQYTRLISFLVNGIPKTK